MVEGKEHRTEDTVVFGIRWDGGRRPRRWLAVAVAALALLVAPAAAQAAPADGPHGVRYTGALVVPASGHARDARSLVCRLGGRPGRHLGIVGGFAARVPASALGRLEQARAVRAASPDVALTVRSTDEESVHRAASSMDVVRGASGAQALQEEGIDGHGVGVALVDTGAMDLPGLDVVRGPDFSTDAADPARRGLDAFGHGTHLAGVIAAHDGAGFTGVAPGATLVSVKVAGADGTTSLLQVLAGLDWVREHADEPGLRIRVVNLSLGVANTDAGYVRAPLAFAAEALWKRGLVVVAAGGNGGSGTTSLDLPAADPYVVAVGALDTEGTVDTSDDVVAGFSSRGSDSRPPDVIAPATRVISFRVPGGTLDTAFPSARVGDRYFRGSGTSQAAAVVSGLAALVLQQRPELNPDQLKALLTGSARDLGDARTMEGAGAVDVATLAGMATPAAGAVAQTWTPAVFDAEAVFGPAGGRDRPGKGRGRKAAGGRMAADNATWAGRSWSGRTWSGRTWSGRTWSGRTWSGRTWSGRSWSGGDWGDDAAPADGSDGADDAVDGS